MNVVTDQETLRVTGLDFWGASNCAEFKLQIREPLSARIQSVKLDCTTARFIGSDGFSARVNLHRRLAAQPGRVRMLQPSAMLRQLLGLLHCNTLFEVVQ